MKILKNVVFSGGGFKGWAYIGTLKALNEQILFKNIEQIIGVSIGSFFGLLYLLQIDPTNLLDFCLKLDLNKYLDVDLDSFLINQSILHGHKFKDLFFEILNGKINKNTTFIELYNKTGIVYTTCAFNINKIKLEYFNKDLTPTINIVDAIMASCAVPLLFPAYPIGEDWYYDGGICNNCPCDFIDPETSIAFDISNHEIVLSEYKLINLVFSLCKMMNNLNKKESFSFKILDNRFDAFMFDLNQTPDMLFNIYMHGYINTKIILTNYFDSGTTDSLELLPKNRESNDLVGNGLALHGKIGNSSS